MTLSTNIRRVLDLLIPKIEAHRHSSSQPIILGITGLQGSGKSTWASKIVSLLTTEHNLNTITVSLDDVYKTHADLITQRDKDPKNKLYRTRGQPGTHDEHLAGKFFHQLRAYTNNNNNNNNNDNDNILRIPRFDKSKFHGEGDRAPESEWPTLTQKPDVVVFEGWCVGFRPLSKTQLEAKYHTAVRNQSHTTTTLADHQLAHLLEVNDSLERYNDAFMGPRHFDFMIHIDTGDLRNVYHWRLQQEHELIEQRGSGMSDGAVVAFVKGYMPGYELYLDGLRGGFFGRGEGRQVRVLLDRERGVESIEVV